MYEELYAPLPDVDAYLRRIGIEDKNFEICPETLSRLIRAHLLSVPFENLDVWATGESPSLAIADIFDKVVTRGRGGYCFELNSLFCKLLCALGFEAYMCSAYVVMNKGFLPTPSHCVSVCVIGGKKYMCDVGLGADMPLFALPMSGDVMGDFRIECEGEYYAVYTPIGKTTLFRDIKVQPVDLVPCSYHISQLPTSPFRTQPVVRRAFEDGYIMLAGSTFKSRHGDKYEEYTISSAEQVRTLLETQFGIPLGNLPVRDV